MPETSADDLPTYVDTPYGLLTATGEWYHVTEDDLRDYAGEVLEYVPLDTLLEWADVWIRSARAVTLWALPGLLWVFPPLPAAASALGLYVGWKVFSPAMTNVATLRVVRWMENVVLQGLYYTFALSAIAVLGGTAKTIVGLAAFILFRFGAVQWALTPVLRPLWRALYPLPAADQVLRSLIIRIALKHRLELSQLDTMTREILNNWSVRTNEQDSDS